MATHKITLTNVGASISSTLDLYRLDGVIWVSHTTDIPKASLIAGYEFEDNTGAVNFKLVDNGACGTETIFYGMGEPTTTETPTTTAVPTTTEEPTTTGLLPVTLALFNNSGYVHITGVIVGGETLFSGDLAPMSSTGTSFEIASAQEELSLQISYTDGGMPSSIVVNDKLGTQCHTTTVSPYNTTVTVNAGEALVIYAQNDVCPPTTTAEPTTTTEVTTTITPTTTESPTTTA